MTKPLVNESITTPVIGIHKSPLKQKFGTPRQPNLVNVASYIDMLAPYSNPEAFVGIEDFSHVWITWQFHHNKKHPHKAQEFRPQVRPPRLGGNKKIGVFATRSMYRPSELGLSVVQLDRVEVLNDKSDKAHKGIRLHIIGADMIDETPIIDIKPYISYSDAISDAQSGYATTQPSYQQVLCSDNVTLKFAELVLDKLITTQDINNIELLIAQDPRPAYKHNDVSIFVMRYGCLDVNFKMIEDNVMFIVDVCVL